MLLVDRLARHWWVIALRGLLAVVFGLLAFAWPGMTLLVLIVLFGAYAIVDGGLGIMAALRGDSHHHMALLLEGVVGLAAGVVAFVWPNVTALVLAYVIAFWAILTGVLEIVAAVRLRRVIQNEWALLVGGALSALFGVVVAAAPGAGALALVWLIGAYAIVFGIALIALSWRLRSHAQQLAGSAPTARPVIP